MRLDFARDSNAMCFLSSSSCLVHRISRLASSSANIVLFSDIICSSVSLVFPPTPSHPQLELDKNERRTEIRTQQSELAKCVVHLQTLEQVYLRTADHVSACDFF